MTDCLFAFELDTGPAERLAPDTLAAAAKHSDQLEIYDALPSVMFATTTFNHAQTIATLPGVISFRSSTLLARQVVWSVNHQVMVAEVHGRTLRRNGVANAVPTRNPRRRVSPFLR